MKTMNAQTDVLVIGGGAAGCSAALEAHEMGARVLMVVKGKIGRSGATPLAAHLTSSRAIPGPYPLLRKLTRAFSAVSDKLPLPLPARYRQLVERVAGQDHYWLIDQDYVLDVGLWIIKEFPDLLERRGLYLLRNEEGRPFSPRGQSKWVAYKAGMSGYHFGESRRKEVLESGIAVMEEATAFSLLTGKSGDAIGAMVLDCRDGGLHAVEARSVILATGHTNWLSKRATATREMSANGLAMAARIGAEFQNLEIQWFHASDSAFPDSWMRLHHFPNRLISGTTHQSVMFDSERKAYMRNEDYDISMPYTIQMKRLYEQVRQGNARWDGGYYTGYPEVDDETLTSLYYHPHFYPSLESDAPNQPMECGITWHMSAGGIRANVKTMETGVPGLFLAGPVGGHQLGGINLATYDGLVAARSAVRRARRKRGEDLDPRQVKACHDAIAAHLSRAGERGVRPIKVKNRIREIVWSNVMYAKTAKGLNEALGQLHDVRHSLLPRMRLGTNTLRYNSDLVEALDVEDMLDVVDMVIHAALARQESRGPHFREDFPFTDNTNWLKHVVVARTNGRVAIRLEPVRQKYARPAPGITDYLANPYA